MKPLFIFDLDGTLSLVEHRTPFVRPPSRNCSDCFGKNSQNCVQCADLDAGWKPNWKAFFAAAKNDWPNVPVIKTLQALKNSGAEIWIWSGRSDECKQDTLEWLEKYKCLEFSYNLGIPRLSMSVDQQLQMRKEGDHREDSVIKAEWFSQISKADYKRLVATFDDRDQAVRMWRERGVTCYQVAPGNF